jgi:ligand-binding sensor domain-containing protein
MRRTSHSQRPSPSPASPPRLLLLLTFSCLHLSHLIPLTAASSTTTPIDGPYIIDSWDTDDGLPQNTVTSITQTRDGYLWFGTHNGLVRFDGLNFTTLDEFNSPELNSSRIVTLFEDSHAQLWIGTETGGIAILRDGRLSNTGIGQYTFEGRLASACQHLNGAVWLYTADGQLWQYHNNRFSPFLHDSDQPSAARIIISEPSGTLWIGTDHRIATLTPHPTSGLLQAPVESSFPVHQLDLLLPSHLGGHWRLANGSIELWSSNQLQRHWGYYPWEDTPITTASEDRHGNLIVGTRGKGVFWLGPPGVVTSLTTQHGLSHNSIRSLELDHEGNLWIGTDAGLNRVKPRLFQVLNGSRSLIAQSASEDPLGNLWVAFQGHGLARWNNQTPHFFGPNQGIPNPDVTAVFVDHNHQVWAGTRGDGLFLLQHHQFLPAPGSHLLHPTILAIHQDRSGRLWIGTQGGLASFHDNQWSLLTTSHGLSSDVIRAIADDHHGHLWIGTGGGGLNRLHNGSFTSFHKQHGLPSEDVSSLYVDSLGALWIGTFGSGLARFHTNHWTLFTTHHGLASNSIGPMLEDDLGHLWIASNAGLMRIPIQSLNDFANGHTAFIQCRVYGKPDGLPTRECSFGSQPGACRSLDGQLWFPTVKGLVGVSPHQLHPNPHPPPVVIESILIDGQPQETNPLRAALSSTVTLPPGKERLQIHFTSLNLGAPDRARFLYRLDKHDPNWIEAGPSRFALYSRLPPGQYQFHVKASNEDGVWNETGRTLAITVLPPIWRTWWFLTTSTLLLLRQRHCLGALPVHSETPAPTASTEAA